MRVASLDDYIWNSGARNVESLIVIDPKYSRRGINLVPAFILQSLKVGVSRL